MNFFFGLNYIMICVFVASTQNEGPWKILSFVLDPSTSLVRTSKPSHVVAYFEYRPNEGKCIKSSFPTKTQPNYPYFSAGNLYVQTVEGCQSFLCGNLKCTLTQTVESSRQAREKFWEHMVSALNLKI